MVEKSDLLSNGRREMSCLKNPIWQLLDRSSSPSSCSWRVRR